MRFTRLNIPDVILIEPTVHGDTRGYFSETFRSDALENELGHAVNFIQDNESKSARGVLRGLHYQLPPHAQTKLVRVISGRVLDVAVDIRQNSPYFGQHIACELSEDNKAQLFIPRGFAHGFVVLSETAIFSYKVDNYYAPQCDRGMAYNDPALNIQWPLASNELKLSDKDQHQPKLAELSDLFDFNVNYYA
jgi:dTDP-4-dehydrorhamnose 3,5-epimerase